MPPPPPPPPPVPIPMLKLDITCGNSMEEFETKESSYVSSMEAVQWEERKKTASGA